MTTPARPDPTPTAPSGSAGPGPAEPGSRGLGSTGLGPAGLGPAGAPATSEGAGGPQVVGDTISGIRRSGLKNPAAAIRGLGAGMLVLEAVVLLLAIQPIRILGGHLSGWAVGSVVALAVFSFLLSGMMRRPWAWTAGSVVQVLLLATVFFHWSLGALGLIFGASWLYALYVRRALQKEPPPREGPPPTA